jgi:lysophospholipase
MRTSTLILSLLFSLSIFSLTDQGYEDLVSELVAIKNKQLKEIQVDFLSFRGAKDKRVNFTKFSKEASGVKGALVISVGRAESSISYYETAKSFLDIGYSPIYVLDHRGQGLSERLLFNKQKGFVEEFNFYGDDFNTFVDEIVKNETKGKKLFLVAHSMGAAVSADSLMRYNNRFDALVFVAPMFKLRLEKSEEETLVDINYYCFFLAKWTGLCKTYIPGGDDFNPKSPFPNNRLTKDKNRYKFMFKAYELWPESELGSATLNWVKESIVATQNIRQNSNKIDIPTLILQAGKDRVVDNIGQDVYCYRSLTCEIMLFSDSEHGILKERSDIRSKALSAIDTFFQQY